MFLVSVFGGHIFTFYFSCGLDKVFKFVTAKFNTVSVFSCSFRLDTFSRFAFTFGLDTDFKLVTENSKQLSFFVTTFGWTTDQLEEHCVVGTSW